MSSLDNRWWMEFATRDNYLSCWLCFLFQIRFPRCSCVSCLVADQMFCFNYCQWRRRTRWPDEIQREWHCYWAAEIPWPGPGGRWQWAGCEAGRGWSVVTSGHHHTSNLSSSQRHLGHVPPPSFRPNYWLQLRAGRESWLLTTELDTETSQGGECDLCINPNSSQVNVEI